MREYHKIQTVYKRDERGNMLLGEFSEPEFAYLWNNVWTFTEKVDGTNVRVMFTEDGIRFGGKTDNAQMPVFLFDRLHELFDGREDALDVGLCLYGEGFGAKIQKGGGNYGSCDFVLFDVLAGDAWLDRINVEDIAVKLGLQVVPIIGEGPLSNMVDHCGVGFDSTWGQFLAEGIVARPKQELRTRRGARVITKLKHRDFRP